MFEYKYNAHLTRVDDSSKVIHLSTGCLFNVYVAIIPLCLVSLYVRSNQCRRACKQAVYTTHTSRMVCCMISTTTHIAFVLVQCLATNCNSVQNALSSGACVPTACHTTLTIISFDRDHAVRERIQQTIKLELQQGATALCPKSTLCSIISRSSLVTRL